MDQLPSAVGRVSTTTRCGRPVVGLTSAAVAVLSASRLTRDGLYSFSAHTLRWIPQWIPMETNIRQEGGPPFTKLVNMLVHTFRVSGTWRLVGQRVPRLATVRWLSEIMSCLTKPEYPRQQLVAGSACFKCNPTALSHYSPTATDFDPSLPHRKSKPVTQHMCSV